MLGETGGSRMWQGERLDRGAVAVEASAKLTGSSGAGRSPQELPGLRAKGSQASVHPYRPDIGCRLPWGTALSLERYGSLQLKAISGEG